MVCADNILSQHYYGTFKLKIYEKIFIFCVVSFITDLL